MKKIKLTKGRYALVDDADFEWLNQWVWYAVKQKNVFYANRHSHDNTNIYMHRQILGLTDRKHQGEHKDRNGLNNQRLNLRVANNSENMCNRPSQKGSVSKYKGVSWDSITRKWRAAITKDGVSKKLGRFTNQKEAALAYNKRAVELHGQFAYLNKVA